MIENYDTNEASSFGTVHVYEVTFMSWEHRAVYEVEVGGNVVGFDLFDSAIDRVYDALPTVPPYNIPALVFVDPNGEDTHIVEQGYSGESDTMGDRFLKDMVTGIVLKEVRRKVEGMYPSTEAMDAMEVADPKRIE